MNMPRRLKPVRTVAPNALTAKPDDRAYDAKHYVEHQALPWGATILLATKPAMRPRTIRPMIDREAHRSSLILIVNYDFAVSK
jgi:hypothetical protein